MMVRAWPAADFAPFALQQLVPAVLNTAMGINLRDAQSVVVRMVVVVVVVVVVQEKKDMGEDESMSDAVSCVQLLQELAQLHIVLFETYGQAFMEALGRTSLRCLCVVMV
jgi:hypothetical protein